MLLYKNTLVKNILSEDWSRIDEGKKLEERGTITCEEVDEVDHLIAVIKKHFPGKSEKDIIYAIASCWHRSEESVPRETFVGKVVLKLCEQNG